MNDIYQMEIMVVDDDPISVELMKRILSKNGYENIQVSNSGLNALEQMNSHPPDLVLLDIFMPGIKGYDVCEKIRENKSTKDIPVLMVTGGNGKDDGIIQKSFNAGATDFIRKPLKPVEFLSRVKSALTIKQTNNSMKEELNRRKQAEEALEISESRSRYIINKSSDSIIIVDKTGVILFANPASEILLGRKMNTLIGDMFGFPMVDGDSAEIAILRNGGRVVDVEMRGVKIKWDGQVAYLATLRDISARKRTEKALNLSLENLEKSLEGTIQSMALTLETRDPYTAGHQRRVAKIACAIAGELGLSEEMIEGLKMTAIIHDLGKISVPAEILSYPGKLSVNQFNIIKEHSQIGYDIMKKIEFPWPIAQTIYQHHEKMDGSGYPQGLSGKNIMIEARILTVADVVEAMASHRPYRPKLGIDVALKEVYSNRGTHFDKKVVDACLTIFNRNGFTI